jgi:hypothetical protein
MTDIRMDVVDLLLDCYDFSIEAISEKRLKHKDGRPFTDEEHTLAGSATRVELEGVRAYWAAVLDHHASTQADMAALRALTEPYFDKLDEEGTIEQVRDLMTPEDRADLDTLLDRIAPDGIVVSAEPLAGESAPFAPMPSDHVLIPMEELMLEASGMTPCAACTGGLAVHVKPANDEVPDGEWNVVRVHTLPCPEVKP